VSFEVVEKERALLARIPVWDGQDILRILLRQDTARFILDRDGTLMAIEPKEPQLETAVLLVLVELARQRHGANQQGPTGSRPLKAV